MTFAEVRLPSVTDKYPLAKLTVPMCSPVTFVACHVTEEAAASTLYRVVPSLEANAVKVSAMVAQRVMNVFMVRGCLMCLSVLLFVPAVEDLDGRPCVFLGPNVFQRRHFSVHDVLQRFGDLLA